MKRSKKGLAVTAVLANLLLASTGAEAILCCGREVSAEDILAGVSTGLRLTSALTDTAISITNTGAQLAGNDDLVARLKTASDWNKRLTPMVTGAVDQFRRGVASFEVNRTTLREMTPAAGSDIIAVLSQVLNTAMAHAKADSDSSLEQAKVSDSSTHIAAGSWSFRVSSTSGPVVTVAPNDVIQARVSAAPNFVHDLDATDDVTIKGWLKTFDAYQAREISPADKVAVKQILTLAMANGAVHLESSTPGVVYICADKPAAFDVNTDPLLTVRLLGTWAPPAHLVVTPA